MKVHFLFLSGFCAILAAVCILDLFVNITTGRDTSLLVDALTAVFIFFSVKCFNLYQLKAGEDQILKDAQRRAGNMLAGSANDAAAPKTAPAAAKSVPKKPRIPDNQVKVNNLDYQELCVLQNLKAVDLRGKIDHDFFLRKFDIADVKAVLRKLFEEGFYQRAPLEETLKDLTVPELKEILKNNNLSTIGEKSELIKRLLEEPNLKKDSRLVTTKIQLTYKGLHAVTTANLALFQLKNPEIDCAFAYDSADTSEPYLTLKEFLKSKLSKKNDYKGLYLLYKDDSDFENAFRYLCYFTCKNLAKNLAFYADKGISQEKPAAPGEETGTFHKILSDAENGNDGDYAGLLDFSYANGKALGEFKKIFNAEFYKKLADNITQYPGEHFLPDKYIVSYLKHALNGNVTDAVSSGYALMETAKKIPLEKFRPVAPVTEKPAARA